MFTSHDILADAQAVLDDLASQCVYETEPYNPARFANDNSPYAKKLKAAAAAKKERLTK